MRKLKFTENLKDIRIKRGYSQQELANYIGVTQASIAQYESGRKSPNVITLDAMSRLFGVSIDCLCYGRNESNERNDTKQLESVAEQQTL